MSSHIAYRARWVFPVDRPPLENATVEVCDGRIADLHQRYDPAARDMGNVAIIPALVNAHAHLELSDIESPIQPASPFTSWLKSVIAHRRQRTVVGEEAIAHGCHECTTTGTGLIGDIVSPAWNEASLGTPAAHVVAFYESLGLRSDQQASQLAAARKHLEEAQQETRLFLKSWASDSPQVIRGLSPHAPYSVHPDLYRGLIDLAAEFRAPLAVHLAESRAELELLDSGTGEFVDFLRELGVWQPDAIPRGSRPFDYLRPLDKLDCALVIHGNYLSAEELDWLAGHPNISVVYCPRTHAFFGHAPHSWREMIDRNIRVALGTDSRASNPDLSLWAELLFLRTRFPEFDAVKLLQLATINGADSLGLGHALGTLTVGKFAKLAVVSFSSTAASNPHDLLFHSANNVTTLPVL